MIRGLFSRGWNSLQASDLLDPSAAWDRISAIFEPPLARLRDFALGAVHQIAEFVLEGAMTMAGTFGGQVMAILRRSGDVFQQIMRDPVGFAGHLVRAVRGGFGRFLTNIGTHLENGLIGWLTGALGGVVRIPERFDLRGVLGMAMELLGLTWDNIRPRIFGMIGERAMNMLERGAGLVADIARNGISAIAGRIAEFTSGLVDTVLGGIREWVTNSVVGAAITRLISMFNPAGAIIQAGVAIYHAIQFVVERARQLTALANSILDSIATIASGNTGPAEVAVEASMGRSVPVALGFLAEQIGLGDIATPVRNVLGRVQAAINSSLDRVIGWIAGMARRLGFGRPGVEPRPAGAVGAEVVRPITLGGQSRTLAADLGTGMVVLRTSADEAAPDPDSRAAVSAEEAEIRRLTHTSGAARAPVSNHLSRIREMLIAGQHRIEARRGRGASARSGNTFVGPLTPQQQRLQAALRDPVRPHGQNQGRVPREGRATDLQLESEHIFPYSWVNFALDQIDRARMVRRRGPVQDRVDDNAMTTVLLYKSASDVKTRGEGRLRFGLNALSRRLLPPRLNPMGTSSSARAVRALPDQGESLRRRWIERSEERRQELLSTLSSMMEWSVRSTERAVDADHRTAGRDALRAHTQTLPTRDHIYQAASRQLVDVTAILTRRLTADVPEPAALMATSEDPATG